MNRLKNFMGKSNQKLMTNLVSATIKLKLQNILEYLGIDTNVPQVHL